MKPFDYAVPADLREASEIRTAYGASSRMLAGGTDLTVGLRHGHVTADMVIDLKRIAELQSDIGEDAGMLRISAGATMMELGRYLAGRDLFPALQEAAAVVGSIQIRNRATLVGNICNASPAADTVPVLAALGGWVEIYGPGGQRSRPVAEFIEGNRQIDLHLGEIVTAVVLPLPKGPQGSAFDRITRRRGVDLATTNMCATINEHGEVICAFGAVSPRPLVVRDESGVLAARDTNPAVRAEAIRRMAAHATPISDVRANADYRSAMLCVMAERALSVASFRRDGGHAHA